MPMKLENSPLGQQRSYYFLCRAGLVSLLHKERLWAGAASWLVPPPLPPMRKPQDNLDKSTTNFLIGLLCACKLRKNIGQSESVAEIRNETAPRVPQNINEHRKSANMQQTKWVYVALYLRFSWCGLEFFWTETRCLNGTWLGVKTLKTLECSEILWNNIAFRLLPLSLSLILLGWNLCAPISPVSQRQVHSVLQHSAASWATCNVCKWESCPCLCMSALGGWGFECAMFVGSWESHGPRQPIRASRPIFHPFFWGGGRDCYYCCWWSSLCRRIRVATYADHFFLYSHTLPWCLVAHADVLWSSFLDWWLQMRRWIYPHLL